VISEALYTAGLPDPDLVIRTGGEQRLSNFLIWQSAYAELYSCAVLWPDFGAEAFDEALLEFARRTRRFGR
jgi:undecaprenyl diphosphate synthase